MHARTWILLAGSTTMLWGAEAAATADRLPGQAREAIRSAVRYYRDSVSTQGGYLWKYSADLAIREGEYHEALGGDRATATQIWVQPPGTPAVGLACASLFETLGDTFYLDAAKDAARALTWGQLAVGGWDYKIDFDPTESQRWFYRRDKDAGAAPEGRRNTATFDDNVTQSALRLLMIVDKAAGFAEPFHDAARYGLDFMLRSQFENGAWPQRYPLGDLVPFGKVEDIVK